MNNSVHHSLQITERAVSKIKPRLFRYETLGRMTGRSYEETVQVLNKGLKNAESQVGC